MKRRYSGNDRHFGPLTFSGHSDESWRPLGVVLDSGDDDEKPGCHIKLHGFGRTLICELPAVVRPLRQWVDTSKYEWSKSPEGGYWDSHRREFGFTVSDGFLQVFLGPQTHDSITTKSWCKHLPWTQWRHVRFSCYDAHGNHFWTQRDGDRKPGISMYDEQSAAEKACPKVVFEFDDFDGERIQATTHIEEREWHFGEGWFKWLSLFRRPMIKRSLDMKFNKEVGPDKGSWKGGTCGHGIEMLPGELHEAAFRRYCEQEHRSKYRNFRIAYVGRESA